MARTDRTKHELARALEEIALRKPMPQIQVKEICERCGVDRTTFYYHFHDKYELVAWIFSQLYSLEAGRFAVTNGEEMMTAMFEHLWERREFFLNALQDHAQNNLREYLLDFYIETEREAVRAHLAAGELDEATEYELRHFSHGCMGLTVEWLEGRCPLTPARIAHYQYALMPEVLRAALAA